jgi:hypothetical protein
VLKLAALLGDSGIFDKSVRVTPRVVGVAAGLEKDELVDWKENSAVAPTKLELWDEKLDSSVPVQAVGIGVCPRELDKKTVDTAGPIEELEAGICVDGPRAVVVTELKLADEVGETDDSLEGEELCGPGEWLGKELRFIVSAVDKACVCNAVGPNVKNVPDVPEVLGRLICVLGRAWDEETRVEELFETFVSVPKVVRLIDGISDISSVTGSIDVENASEAATDDGTFEAFRVGLSELLFDNMLAPMDNEVAEGSICGKVTDTVFVGDDPLEEGKDRESVMLTAPSEPIKSEDTGDKTEALWLDAGVVAEDWDPSLIEEGKIVNVDLEVAESVE